MLVWPHPSASSEILYLQVNNSHNCCGLAPTPCARWQTQHCILPHMQVMSTSNFGQGGGARRLCDCAPICKATCTQHAGRAGTAHAVSLSIWAVECRHTNTVSEYHNVQGSVTLTQCFIKLTALCRHTNAGSRQQRVRHVGRLSCQVTLLMHQHLCQRAFHQQ